MRGKRNCVPSFARNPMAVVSGIAGRSWAPVHRFYEQEQIPCLLPKVDLPVVGDGDFYSVYYCAGVPLGAELMAVKLPAGTKRVVQVFRADDIGAATAKSPTVPAGVQVDDVALEPVAGAEQRRLRMTWPLTWFKTQGIKVTEERTQVDTYLS